MTITRLAAAAVVVLAAAAAAWLWTPQSVSAGGDATPPEITEAESAAVITVHVSGAVAEPGLVELAAGARVADAVAAAGGTLREADLSQLNLAAAVRDGEQVHIATAAPRDGPVAAADDGRVHINRAEPAELERLPGVGPVLAARIASFRQEHGPFEVPEDLLDVPGIGEAKLAAMRDLVAVP